MFRFSILADPGSSCQLCRSGSRPVPSLHSCVARDLGIPTVSFQWVEDCCVQGILLDENSQFFYRPPRTYGIPVDKSETTIDVGWTVCPIGFTSETSVTKQQLVSLCKYCSILVEGRWPLTHTSRRRVCVPRRTSATCPSSQMK